MIETYILMGEVTNKIFSQRWRSVSGKIQLLITKIVCLN